jgi:hypothetical protein
MFGRAYRPGFSLQVLVKVPLRCTLSVGFPLQSLALIRNFNQFSEKRK